MKYKRPNRLGLKPFSILFLILASGILVAGQKSESKIDDFVGTWTSKLKQNEESYTETTISRIENGIEIVDKIFTNRLSSTERRRVFHFDGRIDVNYRSDGTMQQPSKSEFRKGVIVITFLYANNKTGKLETINTWRYRRSKEKLIVTMGTIPDERMGLPRPLELELIRKPS